MTFRLQRRGDVAPSASPYRVVNETGRELEWANRFLDSQRVRGLRELSLRYYGNLSLHLGVRQNLPTYALQNLPTPAAASQPPRR